MQLNKLIPRQLCIYLPTYLFTYVRYCAWLIGGVSVVSSDERPAPHAQLCLGRGVARHRLHSTSDGDLPAQHPRTAEVPQPLPQVHRPSQRQVRPGGLRFPRKDPLGRCIHEGESVVLFAAE